MVRDAQGVRAKLTPLGTVFKSNTLITKFNELELFGVTIFNAAHFDACSSLREIKLPLVLKSISATGRLFGSTKLTQLIIPEGVTYIRADWYFYSSHVVYLELPSTITTVGRHLMRCEALYTVVCKATTPPVSNEAFVNNANVIYVPDDSVDDYKSAQYWSSLASIIKPMSAYTGS